MNNEINKNGLKHIFNSSDILPKEVESRLENQFVDFRKRFAKAEESPSYSFGLFKFKNAWIWSSASALGVAFLILALTVFNSNHNDVFAKTIEALKSVQTVHVEGWTYFKCMIESDGIPISKPEETKWHFERWEWIEPDGQIKSYREGGPYIVFETSERKYMYNKETEKLNVSEYTNARMIDEAPTMAFRLFDDLKPEKMRIDLGSQEIEGIQCYGRRMEMTHLGITLYQDYWFGVETALPHVISYTFKRDDNVQEVSRMYIKYDELVPENVLTYQPPQNTETEYLLKHDPKQDSWENHLQNLAQYYQTNPLPESMELIPRSFSRGFSSYGYPAAMPGIIGYQVIPIKYEFHIFLEDWKPGQVRLADSARSFLPNHDLIYKVLPEDQGRIMPEYQILFVLDKLGLKVREIEESRQVWTAKHDGREMKFWQDIQPPISDTGEKIEISGTGPTYLKQLYESLIKVRDNTENSYLTADHLFIIDETGLAEASNGQDPLPVSNISPDWNGVKDEIIQQWFYDEFGITFINEERTVTIYEIYMD